MEKSVTKGLIILTDFKKGTAAIELPYIVSGACMLSVSLLETLELLCCLFCSGPCRRMGFCMGFHMGIHPELQNVSVVAIGEGYEYMICKYSQ